MLANLDWVAVNQWEQNWWGNCVNTFNEEFKQFAYAKCMGLDVRVFPRSRFPLGKIVFDNSRVLDIGGGPTSMLLKCDRVRGKVVDPCTYPDWVYHRYDAAGIEYEIKMGEDVTETGFDEVWIYNCLQHVCDPVRILQNARRAARTIRIFEWVDTRPCDGHPHTLRKKMLDEALSFNGKVEMLQVDGCVGRCYHGVVRYA